MRLPSIKQQLTEMVALPSVSSSHAQWDMGNLPVIELLATWLSDLGFETEILPLSGAPNKANLIATLGKGPGGLVLSGHTDTVPYDDTRWAQDPFSLTEKNNRWYGLGATDMKGFFPVAIEAAREFLDKPLKEPLIILATADEESSMSGAQALVELGRPKARHAVIGEPTGLTPIRAHKGIAMESIRVQGLAGHSSNPGLGKNAMETMHRVISELMDFRTYLQRTYQNPLFSVEVPTLNLGHIHGGDNPNRICGHCELHFDIRPLPGMPMDELHGLLHSRIQHVSEECDMPVYLESLFPGVPAFEESEHSDLVKTLERLTGHSAEAVAFATEAPHLQKLGMQTVVMGPGSIDQAHQPDEFIELSQIQPAVNVLKQLIAQYCLGEEQ
ncbi:acetylornithine deacetylase [Marinibactrum halimedae]|uniref:Acetylornithine deacetylase n=1 Tax=Marinibactrum halimedae TaxID=1444977 RepID=A0AA37WLS6_9GAMM|nr:acetylornithine deacetylase [Marinibactrum halimedae]MCD9458781.1 acetylornithine deacetylase [Marinibactrum halimedae]GLS25340.1 acetylornithine deacetylase [Marinibactrum halimedae]